MKEEAFMKSLIKKTKKKTKVATKAVCARQGFVKI